MNKKLLILIVLIFLIGLGIGFFLISGESYERDFKVDSVLIKNSMKSGGVFDEKIRIENLDEGDIFVNLELNDLEDILYLDESGIDLGPREVKDIELKGLNFEDLDEGIYIGSLRFYSATNEQSVPIILEIQSKDVIFDSVIESFPTSKIFPGKKIHSNIKIYDFYNVGNANIEMNYFIKNFYGETIVSESESKAVSENAFTKSFDIPENIRQGDYVLGVVISYKNSISTASEFFTIGDHEIVKLPIDVSNIIIFLIFGVVIFVLLLFVFYSVYSKDKLLIGMRNQYKTELRKQDEEIDKKQEKIEEKLDTEEERKVSKKLFREVKVKRKKAIKKIQVVREKILKKLRKSKKSKSSIERQVEKWKKEGYDVSVLGEKEKVPRISDVKKKIRDWKNKGYNTDVLDRKKR
ncbi:hypothetical protein CMI42_05975 [Candidatus Pacearchaeota archaeon]|nr:hypothetical protein [Candidatus Pacearchaeota archaeon]|tara:strand:+ start:724 stop:1947 length:1224 start_codon:yes stop_codon:yes gene_type:complete